MSEWKNDELMLCPICDEGHLHACSEMIEVEHASHTGKIESLYSQCDECGSETATAAQVRVNKRSMIAFKKQPMLTVSSLPDVTRGTTKEVTPYKTKILVEGK